MKTLITILTLALVSLASAQKISLSAKTQAVSKKQSKNWKTDYGSYDKDIFAWRKVAAAVKANASGNVKVNCYWLYKKAGDKTMYLKTDTKDVQLVAGQVKKLEFVNEFVANEAKYKALNIETNSGKIYKGWVITVTNKQGKVLSYKGARPPMVGQVAKILKAEKAANK